MGSLLFANPTTTTIPAVSQVTMTTVVEKGELVGKTSVVFADGAQYDGQIGANLLGTIRGYAGS